MAKKKVQEPTGPGTLMILVLVFFVLASLILGVTTYLGFDGQAKLEEAAKKSADGEKAAKAQFDEQLSRRNVLRVATQTAEPQDIEELSGAMRSQEANILDEQKRLRDKLGAAGVFPGGRKDGFVWAEGSPAPAKTIPQIARGWAELFNDMKTKFNAEVTAHKRATDAKIAAEKRADDQKATFDADVAKLSQQIKDKIAAMDTAFANLKVEADKKGQDFKDIMDKWATEKVGLEEAVRAREQERQIALANLKRLQAGDFSDLAARLDKLDLAKLAERLGTINSKDGSFVTVQFGRTIALVPGQTFVVLPPAQSLVEVIEREKKLEKDHHAFKSLDAREPFTDNEFIKGMIEITDVLPGGSARARITNEPLKIRNPISRGDLLFNMALSTGEQEHVAFAGIIDLDGDGRPDNEAFVRILEKNNLKVDAFLDLKSGVVKGPGIGYKTKFLIIGSDAPLVGGVKTMVAQAKEKSVRLIDSRMFLALIGVKLPKNAAPPAYGNVILGSEGSLNKDPEAPMPPPAPPKDEPKKEEPK